jgi:two-component system chemotaxis response regulator CheY
MARLLIVYGTKELLDWASAILRSAGYEVANAVNGRDALLLIRSDSFDALLVEVANPERDQFELIGSLRQEGKQLRIVALAAGGKAIPSARALMISRALGVDAILYCPCLPDELLGIVQRVLVAPVIC